MVHSNYNFSLGEAFSKKLERFANLTKQEVSINDRSDFARFMELCHESYILLVLMVIQKCHFPRVSGYCRPLILPIQ